MCPWVIKFKTNIGQTHLAKASSIIFYFAFGEFSYASTSIDYFHWRIKLKWLHHIGLQLRLWWNIIIKYEDFFFVSAVCILISRILVARNYFFLIAYPRKICFQFSWCRQRWVHFRNITDFSRENPGNGYTLGKTKKAKQNKKWKRKRQQTNKKKLSQTYNKLELLK